MLQLMVDCENIKGVDYKIDFLIWEQITGLSKAEKEMLLKHLELDNSLRIKSGI